MPIWIRCPGCGYILKQLNSVTFYCSACDQEFDIEETEAAPGIEIEIDEFAESELSNEEMEESAE